MHERKMQHSLQDLSYELLILLKSNGAGTLLPLLSQLCCNTICMNRWQVSHNILVSANVARSRSRLRDMFISGHVTLGNNSSNLCHWRNDIARQVASKIA